MKKFFIALGIAFALIVSGFAVANWWTSMEEANAQAYAEHLEEQAEFYAELESANQEAWDAIVQQASANEETGLYD